MGPPPYLLGELISTGVGTDPDFVSTVVNVIVVDNASDPASAVGVGTVSAEAVLAGSADGTGLGRLTGANTSK